MRKMCNETVIGIPVNWYERNWSIVYVLSEIVFSYVEYMLLCPPTSSRCCWQFSRNANIIWASSWEKRIFAYAKIKPQISCAVTAQLISAIVFHAWMLMDVNSLILTPLRKSLFFLNPKFRASSHIQWLRRLVCVGPGRKLRRLVFSERGSWML